MSGSIFLLFIRIPGVSPECRDSEPVDPSGQYPSLDRRSTRPFGPTAARSLNRMFPRSLDHIHNPEDNPYICDCANMCESDDRNRSTGRTRTAYRVGTGPRRIKAGGRSPTRPSGVGSEFRDEAASDRCYGCQRRLPGGIRRGRNVRRICGWGVLHHDASRVDGVRSASRGRLAPASRPPEEVAVVPGIHRPAVALDLKQPVRTPSSLAGGYVVRPRIGICDRGSRMLILSRNRGSRTVRRDRSYRMVRGNQGWGATKVTRGDRDDSVESPEL